MKLKSVILAFFMLIGLAHAETDVHSNLAEPKLTAELWGSEGNQAVQLDALINKIDTIGYSVVQANRNIQVHWQNMFNEKSLEMISFRITSYNVCYTKLLRWNWSLLPLLLI